MWHELQTRSLNMISLAFFFLVSSRFLRPLWLHVPVARRAPLPRFTSWFPIGDVYSPLFLEQECFTVAVIRAAWIPSEKAFLSTPLLFSVGEPRDNVVISFQTQCLPFYFLSLNVVFCLSRLSVSGCFSPQRGF